MPSKWKDPIGNLDAIKRLKKLAKELNPSADSYTKMKKAEVTKVLNWLEVSVSNLEAEAARLRSSEVENMKSPELPTEDKSETPDNG